LFWASELLVRGQDLSQDSFFSYGSLEERIPQTHPLRPIRTLVDEALKRLSRHFAGLYARSGRPSIAPEKLLRALLVMVLYSVRSERRLMEELEYNLLYRWFVGLGMDASVWDATSFSKNRERFIDGEVARRFFDEVLAEARQRNLVSEEHFSVDGTLIEAWASLKSFRPKDDSGQQPPEDPGNPPSTSEASGVATKRTSPKPIRTRGWRAKAAARKRSCRFAAT
jgi:transposase